MEIQYLLADPTKNITVLVTTPVLRALQPELASLLLNLEPEAEQVGFVDDSPANVATALALGIRGVVHDPASGSGVLRAEIAALLAHET